MQTPLDQHHARGELDGGQHGQHRHPGEDVQAHGAAGAGSGSEMGGLEKEPS